MSTKEVEFFEDLNVYIPKKWHKYVEDSIFTMKTLSRLYMFNFEIEKADENHYALITISDSNFQKQEELIFYSNLISNKEIVNCIATDGNEYLRREKDRFTKSIEFLIKKLE